MKYVDPPDSPRANVLLYGPPKSGKTAGACSAPGPVGLLNADLPNASWYAHRRNAGNVKEFDFAAGIFRTMVDLAQEANRDQLDEQTIVVDPVGDLYRRLLEELSQRAVAPSLPTYLAVQTHVERFCRALCEAPTINAVFVCHEFPVRDEGSGSVERLPYTGTTNTALGQKLMAMVDVIGYTNVVEVEGKEPEYWAQLINGRGRRGGDRFAGVLGRFRELDLSEWLAQLPTATPPQEDSDDGDTER